MWLCTKYGFYSVVHKDGGYSIRARVRNDLKNLLMETGIETEIIFSELTDYPFRIIVQKDDFHKVMSVLEDSVDYPNFKDMIHNQPDQADKPYLEVWAILAEIGSYFWRPKKSRFTDSWF